MSLNDVWPALAGGALIGASATWLLWLEGRIAGISGIVAGALRPATADAVWRWWFLAGLAGGAVLHRALALPVASALLPDQLAPALMIAGGLLVGAGTQLGSGCTSGHGVCGLARLSPRSLVATLVFVAVGMLTVFLVHHLPGEAG
jgi:uncharacterized protein